MHICFTLYPEKLLHAHVPQAPEGGRKEESGSLTANTDAADADGDDRILAFPSDPSRSSGRHHGWRADGHGATDAHLYDDPNDASVPGLLSRRCLASACQQVTSPSFWLHDVHYGRSFGCILCIIGVQFEAEGRLARITMVLVL